MRSYAIRGGQAGKDRLNLLAEIMRPATSLLLTRIGLNEGMTCLDVGCGGGHVARLMAQMVGPLGKVVGTDSDREILALARQDAEADALENIEFRHADALVCQDENTYDLTYARFVLTHLGEPEKCLQAMVKGCKPDGWIAVEDIEFTGSFCYPYSAAYQRYTEMYQEVVRRRHGDANIGPKLPGMLRKSGAKAVQLNVVQPTHLEGEAKFMASITMAKISDAVISEGIGNKNEVDGVIKGLDEAARDPETVISLPRIFQTWGRCP